MDSHGYLRDMWFNGYGSILWVEQVDLFGHMVLPGYMMLVS